MVAEFDLTSSYGAWHTDIRPAMNINGPIRRTRTGANLRLAFWSILIILHSIPSVEFLVAQVGTVDRQQLAGLNSKSSGYQTILPRSGLRRVNSRLQCWQADLSPSLTLRPASR